MTLPVAEIHEDAKRGAKLTLYAFTHEDGAWVGAFERVLPAGTGRTLRHRHLDFEQRYEIRSGRARYRLGREQGTLEPGDELVVPAGVAHVDPHNPFDEPLVLFCATTPLILPATIYMRTIGQAIHRGEVNDEQELRLLQLMAVLRDTGLQTYAAALPVALQRRFAVPLLGRLGRRRGYRAASW